MDKVVVTKSKLTALADAIRSKLGITGTKKLAELTQAVTDFDVGVDVSDANAVDADLLAGATAYSKNGKLTGTIQSIPTRAYQPSTTRQVIAAGQFLAGPQMIERMQLEEKTVTPSSETQEITPSTGKHGLSKVTVNAVSPCKVIDAAATNVTSNAITVTNSAGITNVLSILVLVAKPNSDMPAGGENHITALGAIGDASGNVLAFPIHAMGTSSVGIGLGAEISTIVKLTITSSTITISPTITRLGTFLTSGTYRVLIYGT